MLDLWDLWNLWDLWDLKQSGLVKHILPKGGEVQVAGTL